MKVTLPLGKFGKTGEYGRTYLSPEHRVILADQAADVINKDGPMSLRYVYYRMISGDYDLTVPKTAAEYDRLSKIVVQLRLDGRVNRSNIYDNTRDFNPTCYSEEISPWQSTERIPLVVCESGSLKGMLESVCDRYHVGLSSCGGQPSVTLKFEFLDFVNSCPRPVTIYYVGDHDEAGYAIPAGVLKFIQDNNQVDCELVRVAVSEETIEKYGLSRVIPKNPTKEFPTTTEGEAIPKLLLEQLISEHLDLLGPDLVGANQHIEAEQYHYDKIQEWGTMVHAWLIQGKTLPELGLT